MISPESFASALGLAVLSPAPPRSIDIGVADTCRPGLQFAGYFDIFANERPQVIGKAEMAYLVSLPEDVFEARLEKYFSYPIPCIVIDRGMSCPDRLRLKAQEHGVPIYSTQDVTSAFTTKAITYLSEALAPRTSVHGVLLEVFGVGVLITGESGVGKSECGLELIKRGHLLVADDVVDVTRLGGKLRGEAPEIVRDFMELRGIGIVNIKSIFGVGAVMRRKVIDTIVNLEMWRPDKEYDRLGNQDRTREILGVPIPVIEIPVSMGRNLALIVEIAARNWRLRSEGYDAISELDQRLMKFYGCKSPAQPGCGGSDEIQAKEG